MSQRYREEIEEILKQAGDLPTAKGRPKKGRIGAVSPPSWESAPEPTERPSSWRFLRAVSPGRLMLAGIGLLLLTLLLRATVPGLVGPVAWAGIGLFVLAYVLFFLRPRSPVEKRWRGRLVDDRRRGQPLWQRLLRRGSR